MNIGDNSIWGDVPSWLSAIGTVGSLLAAFWLLREDLKDRRAQRKSAVECDARKISCWCEVVSEKHAILWVQNLSDEPVYNLVGYVGNSNADFNSFPDPENKYMDVVFGLVAPQQKLNYKIDDKRYFSGLQFPDLPQVAIEFTDAQEVHWRRDENGVVKIISHRRPFD